MNNKRIKELENKLWMYENMDLRIVLDELSTKLNPITPWTKEYIKKIEYIAEYIRLTDKIKIVL